MTTCARSRSISLRNDVVPCAVNMLMKNPNPSILANLHLYPNCISVLAKYFDDLCSASSYDNLSICNSGVYL